MIEALVTEVLAARQVIPARRVAVSSTPDEDMSDQHFILDTAERETHTHTRSLSHTRSLTHAHMLTLTHTHTLSLTHTHTPLRRAGETHGVCRWTSGFLTLPELLL